MEKYSYIETFNNKMDWSNTFVRKGDYPLDRTSMFSSYADAVLYANGGKDSRGLSGVSYVGQIITVYENGKVDVYVINSDKSLKSVGGDASPIGYGESEHSAVLKGGNNQVISEGGVAFGENNMAGLKGWYYKAIQFDKTNNVTFLYLSKTQQVPVIVEQASEVEQEKNIDFTLILNDVVSVVNDSKYDNKYKISTDEIATYGRIGIKSIDSNIPFPFDKVKTDEELSDTIFDPEDYSIYCLLKPDAGIVNMGQDSFVSGYNNKATNGKATAFGYNNHAYGKFSFVEGRNNEAAYAAHAEGRETIASGEQSHSEGKYTKASGKNSHAEGIGIYNKDNSIIYTSATGDGSHAEGYATNANGKYSHAEGLKTTVMGDGSHAEGQETQATGIVSHAEGIYSISGVSTNAPKSYVTTDVGWFSHAEGNGTWAKGNSSHAEGLKTYTQGIASHVEGAGSRVGDERDITKLVPINAVDDNFASHAEGQNTTAVGNSSHAEGYGTISVSFGSHAEGGWTSARGNYSHAEGRNTTANADYSHAEGFGSKAYGVGSHSEGHNTVAKGNRSHAEGSGTQTYNLAEHAQGSFNKSTKSTDKSKATQFSIGIGTSDTDRKNAFEVKQNGDIYVEGVEGRIQDKLNDISNINKTIEDNEEVVAAALNELSENINNKCDNSRAEELQTLIINMQTYINALETRIVELETVISQITVQKNN